MDEIVSSTITTTINNFDLSFCIIVNIGTYLAIKWLNEARPNKKLTTWQKRLVLLAVSAIDAAIYAYYGNDLKIIFNSIILAPVSWSWIFKPICNKLNIDYSSKLKDESYSKTGLV